MLLNFSECTGNTFKISFDLYFAKNRNWEYFNDLAINLFDNIFM